MKKHAGFFRRFEKRFGADKARRLRAFMKKAAGRGLVASFRASGNKLTLITKPITMKTRGHGDRVIGMLEVDMEHREDREIEGHGYVAWSGSYVPLPSLKNPRIVVSMAVRNKEPMRLLRLYGDWYVHHPHCNNVKYPSHGAGLVCLAGTNERIYKYLRDGNWPEAITLLCVALTSRVAKYEGTVLQFPRSE